MSKPKPGARLLPKEKSEHGMVLVYTGNGKGKTSAALGLALRAIGRGWKVLMVQFMKGTWHYAELDSARRLGPEFEIVAFGRGFYKILDDHFPEDEHKAAACRTLAFARDKMLSGEYDLVILDEVNVALYSRLIPVQDVLQLLQERPEGVSLLLTGRNAPEELIERADLVTEMREIKHPYQKGIMAQKGLDY